MKPIGAILILGARSMKLRGPDNHGEEYIKNYVQAKNKVWEG
jgi:hypothetical protein